MNLNTLVDTTHNYMIKRVKSDRHKQTFKLNGYRILEQVHCFSSAHPISNANYQSSYILQTWHERLLWLLSQTKHTTQVIHTGLIALIAEVELAFGGAPII